MLFVGVLIAILLLAIGIGIPIVWAIGISTVTVLIVAFDIPLSVIASQTLAGLNNFTWVAIPLFLTFGSFMNSSGITRRLVDFSETIVGHIDGAVSHLAVLVNVLMAGMSGSTIADAAATGAILIPEMRERGYPPGHAAAVIGSSALIGSMIPPSINLLMIGTITQTSILRLWLGGIIPGMLLGIILMCIGYFLARMRHYPKGKRAPFGQIVKTGTVSLPALIIPIVILGGMRAGLFTPTEAAATGMVYILIIASAVYHKLSKKGVIDALRFSAKGSGSIMILVAIAGLFTYMAALLGVGPMLAHVATSISTNPQVFMALSVILALFLGTFMDSAPPILLLAPLLMPIATQYYGIDPIHFGCVFGFSCCLGQITPPVGIAMYITLRLANCNIGEYLKQGGPFLLGAVVCLFLLAFFPQLVLWLPNVIMGT